MNWRVFLKSFVALGLLFFGCLSMLSAAVTPEQKKELIELNRTLPAVAVHIRKKEYTEAENALKAVEDKIVEIAKAAEVESTDKAFSAINKTIATHRKNLDKAQGKTAPKPGKPEAVSFAKNVAPLINEKCVSCHGPSMQCANLRLDTFANWKKGGKGGLLLTPGVPQQSLIMARLTVADARARMPKDEDALERDQLALVSNWISQGAMFDGDSEDTVLSRLRLKTEVEEEEKSIVIAKPKGTETVSFTKDIAPFMANLCVRCHSGNNPNGGLSLETFYNMMRGGDSGKVVLPGEPKDKSRLYRLTGGLENPRMPQGQARITRQNYNDLTKWFEEGCVFDGVDPKTPLRSFVKSEAEMTADKYANYSPAQFQQLRKDRTADQMKRAVPNDPVTYLESDDFLVCGNANEARLKQAESWAKEQVDALRKGLGAPSGPLWKGRLAVIVMKDRFSYTEFNQTVNGRQAPDGMQGHSVVADTYEDAYVVLEDVGDEVDLKSPGLRVNLIDQVTGAYLKRNGSKLPNWLIRGTGLAMAAQVAGRNAYLESLPRESMTIVPTLVNPQDVFADDSFSPGTIGAVGYTLVEYLLKNGGPVKFGQYINELQGGAAATDASTKVYGMDAATLGAQFRAGLTGK
ncbi:MAG: hypothetical protein DWH91_01665 [Planctomycetota bacterium]|nr:MAG: hypothetical protein DWH91_01665 [Planctomycetota bacterium]